MLIHFKFPNGKLVNIDIDQSISLGGLKLALLEPRLRDTYHDTNRTVEEIHISHNDETLTSYFDPLEKHSISEGDTLDVHLDPNDDLPVRYDWMPSRKI